MVQIPTTSRQFYDTARKQSSLNAYAKEVGNGLAQVGNVMDDIQGVKITASLSDAKNKIKLKELELRNKYESNPDDPAFKQEFDAYVNTVYDEQRTNINPFYRGVFNKKARELTKLLNTDNDAWRFKQNGVNLENDMKRIADGLMMDAYDAGNTGDYATAEQVFEQNMATLMPAANKYLGSEKANKALEEMKKSYLAQFAQGMIDDNPTGAEALLNDKAFEQKVGGEKLIGLKRSLKKAQKAEREKARKEAIRQAKDNATEARRLLTEARRAEKERKTEEKERKAEERERQKEEKSAVKDAFDKEKQEQAYRDKIEAETGRRFKYNFETGNYYLSDEKTSKVLVQEEKEHKAEEEKQAQKEEKARINRSIKMAGLMEDFPDRGAFDENAPVSGDSETIGELGETGTLESGEQELKSIMGDEAYNADKAEREKEATEQEEWDEFIHAAPEENNEDAITYVKDEINNLINSSYDFDTDNGQNDFKNATLRAIVAIHNNSAENGGYLTDEERDTYLNQVQEYYNDNYVDGRVKKIYDSILDEQGSTWLDRWIRLAFRNQLEKARKSKPKRKITIQLDEPGSTKLIGREERIPAYTGLTDKRISEISANTFNAVYQAARAGDREAAYKAIDNGNRALLEIKHPEIQGKQVGDIIITNGGIPARLVGIGVDNYYAEKIK